MKYSAYNIHFAPLYIFCFGMWLTFSYFDLAPLVLTYVAPYLIPAEILIIIIIDTMIEEDGPVAIRYNAPLDKAL